MSDHPDFTNEIIPADQLDPDAIVYLISPYYNESEHRERIINDAYDVWESVYQHPSLRKRRAHINEHGLEPVKLKCPNRHPLMTVRMPGSSFDHAALGVDFVVMEKYAGTVEDRRRDIDNRQYGELADLERVTFLCTACRQRNPEANITITLRRLVAVYLGAILQGKRWAVLN